MHFAILFFVVMGALFSFTLVRGLARGALSSKFGLTHRAKEPFVFYLTAILHGFFAVGMFFAALSLSLGLPR